MRGRMLAPIWEARGVPKAILWAGALITLGFVILAICASLISPYAFDQYQSNDRVRFEKQAPPSADHPFGTNVMSTDVMARTIFGARTAIEVTVLSLLLAMAIGSRSASCRATGGEVRPGDALVHGRPDRVPLVPARDRDRVPACRTRSATG